MREGIVEIFGFRYFKDRKRFVREVGWFIFFESSVVILSLVFGRDYYFVLVWGVNKWNWFVGKGLVVVVELEVWVDYLVFVEEGELVCVEIKFVGFEKFEFWFIMFGIFLNLVDEVDVLDWFFKSWVFGIMVREDLCKG